MRSAQGRSDAGQLVLSEEDYRAHVMERAIPADATNVIELAEGWSAPDGDRAFRDAWSINGGVVGIDIAKARDVLKEKMRLARKPLLEQLDMEYLRADEIKDETKKAEIAAAKQSLRDVTALAAIDSAKTHGELRAAWPVDVLGSSPVKTVKRASSDRDA
jgi:hypothetical protein